MLELIAKTGLFFSQPIVLASIVLVGFLNRHEVIFGRTLLILLFTMIYNVYLKSIWQLPLPAPMEGWAFPSGHMHSAVVFWGALAIEFRRFWFSALVVFVLCLAGYGLVYHGYHYPIDIAGAVGFGSLSLLIYRYLQQKSLFKEKPYRLGILLTLLAVICILLTPAFARKLHLWQAFGALIGFTLGWALLSKQQQNLAHFFNIKQRFMVLSIALMGACAYFYLIRTLPLGQQLMIFSQFFLIAIWVNASKMIIYRLSKKVGYQ
ncbi:phosphatase PAP2 family protein [Candidatus Berkiella aquae]|uniref:PAP2 superfamily protein n=1 Tax=Candidatus Berkiella aquae TaxID=295108 RepID=A0A0Q9YXR8_9GAMM|nr:phosphatase PAP2 family protein [Candidatus Berkiella aquae]MCS5712089.1 phosphatase PAP2 family protein [Candidatus Berkiella aquae]